MSMNQGYLVTVRRVTQVMEYATFKVFSSNERYVERDARTAIEANKNCVEWVEQTQKRAVDILSTHPIAESKLIEELPEDAS